VSYRGEGHKKPWRARVRVHKPNLKLCYRTISHYYTEKEAMRVYEEHQKEKEKEKEKGAAGGGAAGGGEGGGVSDTM